MSEPLVLGQAVHPSEGLDGVVGVPVLDRITRLVRPVVPEHSLVPQRDAAVSDRGGTQERSDSLGRSGSDKSRSGDDVSQHVVGGSPSR